jgi:urea transport system ATP-binding protein
MYDLLKSFRRSEAAAEKCALRYGRHPAQGLQWTSRHFASWTALFIALLVIPALYLTGNMSIESVNNLGRYLCFVIVAISLDLIWGYGGMLCLCQFLFFSLGGYAMGMFLAHHGGPEGIIDADNWGKIPACLFVVYPGQVGETQAQWTVPFFWKPFWSLPVTLILGMLIPAMVAGLIGFFVFRSRVRGVFFAVLTQAILLAVWLVFSMNDMKLCGTNGLTRFDRITTSSREKIEIIVDRERLAQNQLTFHDVQRAIDGEKARIQKEHEDRSDAALTQLSVSEEDNRITMRLDRSLHVWDTQNDVKSLVLAQEEAEVVRLGDVATVDIVGFKLTDKNVKLGLYVITVLALGATFWVCGRLMHSRIGRVLIAIRDNENRLRFSGYQPYLFKMFVFALSGAIAGLAGMLYAPQMRIFTPTNFLPTESIYVVIWVAVGGRATLSGPILGALVVSFAYSLLTSHAPIAWPFVLGGLFLAVVLVLPDGLMSLWHRWTSLSWTTPAAGPVRSAASPQTDKLSDAQKRMDGMIAVLGMLSVAIGLYAAWRLWQYGKPYDLGLMAQHSGSAVVVGLMMVLTAFCGVMLVLSGLGMILGRPWGIRWCSNVLKFLLGLVIATIAWYFFIDQLRGGLWNWLGSGVGRVHALVGDVPEYAILAVWAVATLLVISRLDKVLIFLAGLIVATSVYYLAIEGWLPDSAHGALDALLLGLWTGLLVFTLGRSSLSPSIGQLYEQMAPVEEAAEEEEGKVEEEASQVKADFESRLSRLALRQRAGPIESPVKGSLMHVEDITVLFDGFKALDIQTFSVEHFELNVIIGPNGAGKTTLCDVISGMTRPTTGKVFFAGQEITNMPEVNIARLGVGRKFQTPTVFDSLSVYQNMELVLPGNDRLVPRFRKRSRSDESDRIHGILKRVRLNDHTDQQVRYLSHGQRQWLEISMLILASPPLLLVDEPAAGLTDEETLLTAELLLELQDEHSVIVIEHDMEFVRMLGSKVTVLNEGKVIAYGSMEEIQRNPEVIEAYLGR